METIVKTDKADAFVQKLNSNFAEAASSGGGSGSGGSLPNATRTINVSMQGGMMDGGYTKGNIAAGSPNQFFRYIHSVLMMDIEYCTITDVVLESGETLTIYYYGADGAYVGSVSSVANIPSTACYVKFQVTKSSNYTSIRPLAVTVRGLATFCKNNVPTLVDYKYISFETTMPTRVETLSTDTDYNTYIGNNTRYWDNGYIKMPPNYTKDGEPVPLIVFVHGTGGYGFTSGPSDLYKDLQTFVVNNGYALCDCSGLTNANSNVGNSFAAPSMMSSIVNLVKFITANYNVKDDGIYVFGKSSGGFIVPMLTRMGSIKVKAAGMLAPALSPMVSMAHHARTYNASANLEATQIGITSTISSSFTDNDKALITGNVAKWREIDPFFSNTDLTDEQVRQLVQNNYDAGGSSYNLNIAGITANATILNAAKRWVNCPTKIWVALDDYTVYHANSKMFVDMAKRTGSPCYLRTLPSGTGQHHAVDTADNAVKTTYRTKYADTIEVVAAYAELIDWFNRW